MLLDVWFPPLVVRILFFCIQSEEFTCGLCVCCSCLVGHEDHVGSLRFFFVVRLGIRINSISAGASVLFVLMGPYLVCSRCYVLDILADE